MNNFFPCDHCAHDIKGCCDYDEPLGQFCVLGSGFIQKPMDQISIEEIMEDQNG